MDEKRRISPYSKRLTITVLTMALGATALSINPAMADELELNKGIQFVEVVNYVVSAENQYEQYTDEVAISDILEITMNLTAPEYIKQDETTNITLDAKNLGDQQVKWTATKDGVPFELPQGLTNTGGSIDLTEMGQYVITATAVDTTGKEVSTSSIVNVESKFWQITSDGEIKPSEKTKINGPYYQEFCAQDGLTIPDTFMGLTVTKIADYAFCDFNTYKGYEVKGKLIIPDDVTNIGNYAFFNCNNLTGILTLPQNLINIGENTFANCKNLNGKLNLPKSLKSIGNRAFAASDGFSEDLIIPEGLVNLGTEAFSYSGEFNNIVIPSTLDVISDKSFFKCRSTGILSISDGVKIIGKEAFSANQFTGNLVIPNSITEIKENAFKSCGFDGTLKLSETLTSIGNGAFYDCHALTGNIIIPASVKTIGDNAFRECRRLNGTLVLKKGLTTIGKNTFADCYKLTGDLIIPDSVTEIGERAFVNCHSFLGKLRLSENLTAINAYTFNHCGSFTGDLVVPANIKIIYEGAFQDFSLESGKLLLLEGLLSIQKNAFAYCNGIEGNINIPSTLTQISSNTFDMLWVSSPLVGNYIYQNQPYPDYSDFLTAFEAAGNTII